MGNFNVEPNDANMKDFCQIYDDDTRVGQPTPKHQPKP